MAWENGLDRLILQQVHLAEKGEARASDVQQQIESLWRLKPDRAESAFHLGYGRALLGIELPEPSPDQQTARRWYLYGRLRGHDHRAERNWVADLLHEPAAIMELLSEPKIAGQCLPVVMRTLFWCNDLDLAFKAIEYLAAQEVHDTDLVVDAALSDLLVRLEKRGEATSDEGAHRILQRVIDLDIFGRLPADVRARYHRAKAAQLLLASEFEPALEELHRAEDLLPRNDRLQSHVACLGALAELSLHDVGEVRPRAERPRRPAALAWLQKATANPDTTVPEASFARGVLAYEVGDFAGAQGWFDQALRGIRRVSGREAQLADDVRFFLAAAILAGGDKDEVPRAVRLMDQALDSVTPDLETFYPVHEALKAHDRKVALRFLDAVDVGRGTAPDQLLFVALEYLSLGEAEPAAAAADRVLQMAVNLDQRVEAMRVLLTAANMRGNRAQAREVFCDMRDLLLQRGALPELEAILKNEETVGQALDHLDAKCELVALYEEMEDRDVEKATLQTAIARSLRARKDVESLREAHGILKEVEITFPDLAREDLQALEKLLALSHAEPAGADAASGACAAARAALGRPPRVLVVGGNERQRRHHPRFEALAKEWGFAGEWLMANYTSPQKLVNAIGDRLGKVDLLLLLHWNRHETTEPALELARKAEVPARTVHYAGFTSLQIALEDALAKLAAKAAPEPARSGAKGKGKSPARS